MNICQLKECVISARKDFFACESGDSLSVLMNDTGVDGSRGDSYFHKI